MDLVNTSLHQEYLPLKMQHSQGTYRSKGCKQLSLMDKGIGNPKQQRDQHKIQIMAPSQGVDIPLQVVKLPGRKRRHK